MCYRQAVKSGRKVEGRPKNSQARILFDKTGTVKDIKGTAQRDRFGKSKASTNVVDPHHIDENPDAECGSGFDLSH